MINFKISFYSIAIILSLISNIIVVLLLKKKYRFNTAEVMGALVYENIGIIFGAKLLTYLQNIASYSEFNFYTLGFSSYGGVIGGIICLLIFCLQFKKPIKEVFFLFMPSIPLMYAIGKIGCFIVGCCYGIEYNGIGSIVYNHSLIASKGVHLFPVQIIETIVFIGIFLYMFICQKNNKFNLKTLGISFILCGLGKYILDYFRESHVGNIISLNQVISIIFIIIGIFIILKNKKKESN